RMQRAVALQVAGDLGDRLGALRAVEPVARQRERAVPGGAELRKQPVVQLHRERVFPVSGLVACAGTGHAAAKVGTAQTQHPRQRRRPASMHAKDQQAPGIGKALAHCGFCGPVSPRPVSGTSSSWSCSLIERVSDVACASVSTMYGTIITISSVLFSRLFCDLNRLPSSGISFRYGTPPSDAELRRDINPPMITELPSCRLRLVLTARLKIDGDCTVESEPSGSASLTSWRTSRSMRLSEYTTGLMSRMMPVLRYCTDCRMLDVPSVCCSEAVCAEMVGTSVPTSMLASSPLLTSRRGVERTLTLLLSANARSCARVSPAMSSR